MNDMSHGSVNGVLGALVLDEELSKVSLVVSILASGDSVHTSAKDGEGVLKAVCTYAVGVVLDVDVECAVWMAGYL